MSEEQLKAFLEAVKADAGLQEKLKAAADANAVASVAKEAGFSISSDYLNKAQSELSDADLEVITGGWMDIHWAGVLSALGTQCPWKNDFNCYHKFD